MFARLLASLAIAAATALAVPTAPAQASPRLETDYIEGYSIAAAGSVLGTHHVTVVPVYWLTSALPGGQPTTAQLTADVADVDKYWNGATGGRIRVTADAVRPWQRIPAVAGCDYQAIAAAVRKITGSTVGDPFHHVAAYFPQVAECGFAGLATLGSSERGDGFIWLNGNASQHVFGHEFGHNLGLRHANGLSCSQGPLTGTCKVVEYGDAWDIMGNRAAGQTSALHLDQLGVLPASATRALEPFRAARVTLAPITGQAGLRQVTFPLNGRTYSVEYRGAADGIAVRYDTSDGTNLVNFHPAEANRPGLLAGESWTAPDGSFGFAAGAGGDVSFLRGSDVTPPAIAAGPVAAVRTGGTVTAKAVPVTVSWGAVTDASGVRTVEVARRDNPYFAPVKTTARSLAQNARTSGTNVWLVRTTDKLDNTRTVAGHAATAKVDPQNRRGGGYRGVWKTVKVASALGGTEQRTTAKGASVTFTATARSIGWITTRDKTRGTVSVYVDGRKVAVVDLRSPTTAHRRVGFAYTWPSAGRHTIKVVGNGRTMSVDGFTTVD